MNECTYCTIGYTIQRCWNDVKTVAKLTLKRVYIYTLSVLNENELAAVAKYILEAHARPNNYVVAKAVAEKLISEERGQLPICIFRPSNVGCSSVEPMKVIMHMSGMCRHHCLLPVSATMTC